MAVGKRQLSNDGEMLAYYYNTKREAADSDGFNYFPEIDVKIQIAPQLYSSAPSDTSNFRDVINSILQRAPRSSE